MGISMGFTFLAMGLGFTLLSHWVYDSKVEYPMLLGAGISLVLAIVCFIVGA